MVHKRGHFLLFPQVSRRKKHRVNMFIFKFDKKAENVQLQLRHGTEK